MTLLILWFCFQSSEVDAAEVQEKVKEVICKTITSIPLTDATSRERLNSDEVSQINEKGSYCIKVCDCFSQDMVTQYDIIVMFGVCTKSHLAVDHYGNFACAINPFLSKRFPIDE